MEQLAPQAEAGLEAVEERVMSKPVAQVASSALEAEPPLPQPRQRGHPPRQCTWGNGLSSPQRRRPPERWHCKRCIGIEVPYSHPKSGVKQWQHYRMPSSRLQAFEPALSAESRWLASR
jgi:hypothetical protein